MVTVPLIFLIALVAGVVYFVSHDVIESVQESFKAAILGSTDDANQEFTRISDEEMNTGRSGKEGGKGVEKYSRASTGDNDGEIIEDARPGGTVAWIRERVDLEGLLTKFKILLVLYQVGIPQSTVIALTSA
jgi:hypothetical protein